MNSPEGESLQIALLLIKQYEDEHYTIPLPDPIEAVKLKIEFTCVPLVHSTGLQEETGGGADKIN